MTHKIKILDAAIAVGFVLAQTTSIERQVNEQLYPDIQYPGLIPVDSTAHPFAPTVTYFGADRFGKAEWINGNSDDVPIAGTTRTKHETQVYTAGIGYAYGFEEIGLAQMMGRNLPAEDAVAARRAYEEFVDEVAMFGDELKGFYGLVNNPDVGVVAATNGNWLDNTTTPAQILEDFNAAILGTFTNTNTTEIADTVLMPYQQYLKLATTMLTAQNSETILDFLRRANVYTAQTGRPLVIRGLRRLDTIGSSGTGRLIAYRRDPMVLKLHIPMPHRFLPAHAAGPLRVQVPGVFRMGGTDIRRPKAVVYMDGI